MTRTNRLIAGVVTAGAVLLVLLVCAGPLVSAQAPAAQSTASRTAGATTDGAPTTSAPEPAAQSPVTQPANPEAPVAEPGLEAQAQAAAPMLQFSLSTGTVNFGGSLTPGQTHTQSIAAVVNSNQTWRISVTKSGDLQGASGSIPSSYFTFSAVGPAGYTTYQAPAGTEFGTDSLVVSGTRGSNLATAITYRLSVPWDLPADSYSASHSYTAVQI